MTLKHAPLYASLLSAALAAPTLAQEGPAGPEAEVARLQAMLAKVDAALARLRPVNRPPVTFAQYDIRHLLFKPIDRHPPNLTIPAESAGARTGEGAGGFFSFEACESESNSILEPDQLEEIVTRTIGEDRWDDPCSIEINDGYLLVRQTPAAHEAIARLLNEFKGRQNRTVQLEVGFYNLSDELQARIEAAAASTRGSLPPAVLTQLDQAVERGEAKLTGSAMLTALDEQQVYLHQGAEQSFVSAFYQSSGGTGSVVESVADPIVDVLMSGLTLDLRPTLIGEGRRPLVSLDVRFVRSRPLDMGHSSTPWGAIDVPRVVVDSVHTSAQIPSGGGMLVFSARASQDEAQPDVTIIVRPLVIADEDR